MGSTTPVPAGALLVRAVPEKVALRVEVFPALPLSETGVAISSTVSRLGGADQAVVVTTFGVFLLAPPVTIVSFKDGSPALTLGYGWGAELQPMERLLAGTSALWRRAKLPPPAGNDDLLLQAYHWIHRVAADPDHTLPLRVPGMPGLAAAWLHRVGRGLHHLAIEQLTTDDVYREVVIAQYRSKA